MDNVQEARELIRKIRCELGIVEESGELTRSGRTCEKTLRILSEELYSTPTHFILELVQNADDNKYHADVLPHLTVVYRTDGQLWVGCNEIGFTEKNVESICDAGDSTKKVEGAKKGYIGEKGIGFKSVFKVADEVWISSGALSFKFDKKKPLGMIAPEWCDFPCNEHVNATTMFCLQIPEVKDRQTVKEQIMSLKPELLLFLRQLRGITVKIYDDSGPVKRSFTLKRSDKAFEGARMTSLSRQYHSRPQDIEDYLVCERTATEMPLQSRREGVSESQLLIAFPISAATEPNIRNQLTFNFLPIRAYGLPFVLQGDFALSANREDIIQENEWNNRILSVAVDLFVQSVQLFNDRDFLKYTWPRYLQSQTSAHGTVFQNFRENLLRRLRKEPVLQSQALTMESPVDLRCVPQIFTDGTNSAVPLLEGSNGMSSWAANGYSFNDLKRVEVPELSPKDFTVLLRKYVTYSAESFHQREAAWQSRLANAILHAGPSGVRDLPIVPLRGGRWVPATATKLYFPDIGAGFTLPSGIRVDIIEDGAVHDPSRYELFTRLGARHLNSAEVFQIILEEHAKHGSSYITWSAETVVAHAWFLFKSPTKPSDYDLGALRLASKNSPLLHSGKDLYMELPESTFRISDYLSVTSNVAHYLHDQYLTVAPPGQAKAWLKWLQNGIGVRTMPKLMDSGKVSQEFQAIIDSVPNNGWMLLLKNHWAHYAKELLTLNSEQLQNAFSKAKVVCTKGPPRQLKQVYLTTQAIIDEPLLQNVVPLLDVQNPKDVKWLEFRCFGLNTSPNAQLYLKVLEEVKSRSLQQPVTLKEVESVYIGLDRYMKTNEKLVKARNLVFVPGPNSNRWLSSTVCRWTCPSGMRSFTALRDVYPNLFGFFFEGLGVMNPTASDVVGELLTMVARTDQLSSIKSLLLALSKRVGSSTEEEKKAISRLTNAKILPMTGDIRFLSFKDSSWFIADSQPLGRCFQGTVSLLDFDKEGLVELSPLLQFFGVKNRGLSANVKDKTQTSGDEVCHAALTEKLRAKAQFIACLVHSSHSQRVFDQLSKLEVRYSTSLKLRRFVLINEHPIYGKDQDGYILLKQTKQGMVVCISSKVAASARLPGKHLAGKLMFPLGISKEREVLLLAILTTDSPSEIADILVDDNIDISALLPAEKPAAKVEKPAAKVENADVAQESSTKPDPKLTAPAIPTASIQTPKSLNTEVSDHPKPPATEARPPSPLPDVKIKTSLSNDTPEQNANGHRASRQSPALSSDDGSTTARTGTRRSAQGAKLAYSDFDSSAYLATPELASIDIVASSAIKATTINGRGTQSTSGAAQTIYRPNGVNGDDSSESSDSVDGDLFDHFKTRPEKKKTAAFNVPALAAASMRSQSPYVSQEDVPARSSADDEKIGFGGELFVYNFFKERFHAGEECWTSNLRVKHGLPPFEGNEANTADFTFSDSKTSTKIRDWLVDAGHADQVMLLSKNATYHFEVKATSGDHDEPFSMSNNQMDLAQTWTGSTSDVYIVLRVSRLLSQSRKLRVYLDPWKLINDGELSLSAPSWNVQPTKY